MASKEGEPWKQQDLPSAYPAAGGVAGGMDSDQSTRSRNMDDENENATTEERTTTQFGSPSLQQQQASSSVAEAGASLNKKDVDLGPPVFQKRRRRISVEDNAKLFSHFHLLDERRRSKVNGRESGHRMCYCLHCEREYQTGLQSAESYRWVDKQPIKMTRTRRDCFCHLRRCTAFLQYLQSTGQANPFPAYDAAVGGAMEEDCSMLRHYSDLGGVGGGGPVHSSILPKDGKTSNSADNDDTTTPKVAVAPPAGESAKTPGFPLYLGTAEFNTSNVMAVLPAAAAAATSMSIATGVKRKRGRPRKLLQGAPTITMMTLQQPTLPSADAAKTVAASVRMDQPHNRPLYNSPAASTTTTTTAASGIPLHTNPIAKAAVTATMLEQVNLPLPAKALANHVTEFIVDCNLPLSILERPSFQRLVDFFRLPWASTLPLPQAAAAVFAKAQMKIIASIDQAIHSRGHRPGMVLRTWMDRTQTPVNEITLTVGPSSYPLACRLANYSCQHGMAVARDWEQLLGSSYTSLQKKYNFSYVCVATSTSPAARARRILAVRHPRVLWNRCWDHQLNLMVLALFQQMDQFRSICRTAGTSAAAIHASGVAPTLKPAFHSVLKQTYGGGGGETTSSQQKEEQRIRIYTLLESHWNSMQFCFASLLRIKDACEAFAKTSAVAFPQECQVWKQDSFWTQLTQAEMLIRPFCEFSHRLQHPSTSGVGENTLAHVLFLMLYLHQHVAEKCGGTEKQASALILQDLEKRWMREENALFVLAFALHPSFREFAVAMLAGSHKLYGNYSTAGNALSVARLAEAARFYYDKFELYRRHDRLDDGGNKNDSTTATTTTTANDQNKTDEELQNISKEMRKWLSGKDFAVEEYDPRESVVEWWEMHAFEYPELANLAMFLLDAPVVSTTTPAAVVVEDGGGRGRGQRWSTLRTTSPSHYKPLNRHLGHETVHQFNVINHDLRQHTSQASAVGNEKSKTRVRGGRADTTILQRYMLSPEPLLRVNVEAASAPSVEKETDGQEEAGGVAAAGAAVTTIIPNEDKNKSKIVGDNNNNNNSQGKVPPVEPCQTNEEKNGNDELLHMDDDDDVLIDPEIWTRILNQSVPDDDDLDGFSAAFNNHYSPSSSIASGEGGKSQALLGSRQGVNDKHKNEEEAYDDRQRNNYQHLHSGDTLPPLPLKNDVFYPEEDARYFMGCMSVRVDKYSLSKILEAAKEAGEKLPTLTVV